jgi:hypothetical protein
MEWVKDNWILISIAAFVIGIYFFGHRKHEGQGEEHSHESHQSENSSGEKAKKSGHGCCH